MKSIILICNKCDHHFLYEHTMKGFFIFTRGWFEKKKMKRIFCPYCGSLVEIELTPKFSDGTQYILFSGAKRGLSLEIGGVEIGELE